MSWHIIYDLEGNFSIKSRKDGINTFQVLNKYPIPDFMKGTSAMTVMMVNSLVEKKHPLLMLSMLSSYKQLWRISYTFQLYSSDIVPLLKT
jgi:hypothetical protein